MEPSQFSTQRFSDSDGSNTLFTQVSYNLQQLGALPVDSFLFGKSTSADFDFAYQTRDLDNFPQESPIPSTANNSLEHDEDKMLSTAVAPSLKMHAVSRLHQTCQRVFASTDGIKFEYLEEGGPNTKQCILTISRPDGTSRSYKTEPVFSRKNDAKAKAAEIAIDMGAVDFIVTGESEILKSKMGILAPLDALDPYRGRASEDEHPMLVQIEECCKEWRAGRVMPHWVPLSDFKPIQKHGAALRIQLSSHSFRVYSTDTTFSSFPEAKIACGKTALEQGVLDYIRFGNGQTQPAAVDSQEEWSSATIGEKSWTTLSSLTLQAFYESLPQPFPESFGNKSASEINAPAWLNNTLQAYKGCRFNAQFIWTCDNAVGLHGCLFRLNRPGECRSYLVDSRFSKRADAKAAVCLLAISQGVGSYIRTVTTAVENKITPELRKLITDQILPVLTSETHKVKPGAHPLFAYHKDKDAFGCTLKLVYTAHGDIREFSVPAEYCTKADAKIAVAGLASRQGAIELLRFRGEPPPPEYLAILANQLEATLHGHKAEKRKDMDVESNNGPEHKKSHQVPDQVAPGSATGSISHSGKPGKHSRRRRKTGGNYNMPPSSSPFPGTAIAGLSANMYNPGASIGFGGGPVGYPHLVPSQAQMFRGGAHPHQTASAVMHSQAAMPAASPIALPSVVYSQSPMPPFTQDPCYNASFHQTCNPGFPS